MLKIFRRKFRRNGFTASAARNFPNCNAVELWPFCNCGASADLVFMRSALVCDTAALLRRLAEQSINITPSLHSLAAPVHNPPARPLSCTPRTTLSLTWPDGHCDTRLRNDKYELPPPNRLPAHKLIPGRVAVQLTLLNAAEL